jgi:hypothetical protein
MRTVTATNEATIRPRALTDLLDALALDLDASIARLEGVLVYLDLVGAQLAAAATGGPESSE